MTVLTPLEQKVFAYRAQTADGKPLSGTVDAFDADDAKQQLEAMRLRVLEVAEAPAAAPARRMGSEEFQAFNHQLAMLTQAGLPLEKSLRMISRDLGSRRLAATVDEVAGELERGTPLGEAFDKHRGKFPALYGQLIDVGLRTNRLPGVLLSLGRHFELVQRLRSALWQAMAYPLVLVVMLAAVVMFMGWMILPQFREIYTEFDTRLPVATQWLLDVAQIMPQLTIGIVAAVIAVMLIWSAARASGWQGAITDAIARSAPMVGPVLRRSLAMRWCDTVKIAVEAGLDLPTALAMAGDAVDSPALRRDSRLLAEALSDGKAMSSAGPLRILPEGVPTAMELAAAQGNLAGVLESLADMNAKQAELRLGMMNAVLMPALLLVIGVGVALILVLLVMPLISLIEALT